MIFLLKNDNYKSFNIFKENVLQPRSYFIPFSSYDEAGSNDVRTERYNSSMVNVLSGEWNFKYYEKLSLMPNEIDVDDFDFDKVQVPSVWQHTGYEKPYYVNTRYQFNPNPPEIPEDIPVGIYHKVFEIDDENANYTLTFLGVAGSLDVFVNGKYVGYSEGSHNTSEFELNEFINAGENHLVAVVHKWCNGTYLECQDMFRNNGIFRDVYITKTGNNSIYDFLVETKYIDSYRYDLTIIPSLKLTDECELSATVIYNNEIVAQGSINASKDSAGKISFSELEVEEWSAETPNLYDLILTLSNEDGVIEVIHRPIGFKHIKITGNVFAFNNKAIKLFGINHHDTDPKNGYVMSVEDMERDVKIFKDYNANCVRTSHYPPDPIFLDLCDEYGLYVVDEADIETHGCETELHKNGACSHNPAWQSRYWDRVYRMFERDKNHPSITMWSLGNEAGGYKNQDYCYAQLKKLSTIPVHYENVNRTRRFAYDVISTMYPWFPLYDRLEKGKGLPKKWFDKPYFMCEYAHAMGLGAGDLERYVKGFLNADNLMGGCIWEFVDHAIYHEDEKYKYTYGGDHGEWKHDSNFCVDGLFFPDRTPHAGALQMKNCYRPVRAEKANNGFKFFNYNYFADVNYIVKWSTQSESGEFELSIPPRKSQSVDLDVKADYIIFKYFDDDFEIAGEQIDLGFSIETTKVSSDKAPVVSNSEEKLYIKTSVGDIVYNARTGEIESYMVNGNELINSAPFGTRVGFGASIYRAPIDNDMYIKNIWSRLKLDTEKIFITSKSATKKNMNIDKVYRIEDNNVVIEADYRLATISKKKLLGLTITYTISNDGSIRVDLACNKSKNILNAPRFGLILEMPKQFDNVKYFGRGDRPNTSDFKEHALMGEYSMKVDDMRERYIKPQESSMRTDVRWAEITNDEGNGFRFVPQGKAMTFGADHFTSQQCAKAMHQEDLKICDTTMVHLDGYMLGAGSNACGPVPTGEHRLNNLNNQFISVLVQPIISE